MNSSPTARRVEIIAHRGASFDAPENTLAAVQLGWEQEADAVEIDVRLSRDGRIVVIHDDNTLRTAGVDRKVVEQTLAELRELDAGGWKSTAFAGEKIPTLSEVVATIPDGKRLVVEIKCGVEILPELEIVLSASGRPHDQFIIIAFSHEVIREVKSAWPAITAFWLSGLAPEPGRSVENLIAMAKDIGADGLNLHFAGVAEDDVVAQIHAAGFACYVWTVDDAGEAQHLVAAGVDGITSNRPLWLRQQLSA